jgi:hypothetical protein
VVDGSRSCTARQSGSVPPAYEHPGDDPVLLRRARIAKLVELGQRTGYGLFGLALVLFFVGFFAGFTSTITTVVVGSLIVGSLVLAPAIVFGYAVKAAERADQGLPDGH